MIEKLDSAWAHYNPVRITAGAGVVARLHEWVPADAQVLLVTTPGFTSRGLTARLVRLLGPRRVLVYDSVTPNPELEDLDRATERFKASGVTLVVALGGGSAIDAAKTLALTIPCNFSFPLERVLRAGVRHEWVRGMPVIAIPTTSGTGAEVTPFATVWDKSTRKKYSVADESIYPVHAVLDPALTLTLPRDQTLYAALDAISHSLESLWNKNRTHLSAILSLKALELANNALPVILEAPDDLDNRSAMQLASLLAGLAISQTRTAIAHSISYPLTSHFGVPHGLACSFTLHELLIANQRQWMADPVQARLLNSVAMLLLRLRLAEKVLRYAPMLAILKLSGEMFTKGRAENYAGEMGKGLDALLTNSLNADAYTGR